MQSDRRLVRLVREGYETAFEEIVRRYGRPLGRYAGAIVGSRSEDVTQDAFSKALLALRRDDAEIELRPWLYRIVRNTALNDLRDRPPAAAELAEAIAGGESPAERIEQREELTTLMDRLRALPEAQRAAIVMRELEGLSHDEIAAALGMSGGAARQAIYRARQALRDAAGMLVPLPLLKAALAADSPAAAEAAGGAIGLAGAGMAVKATAATVLVAGTVGAGVALQDTGERRDDAPKMSVKARDAATPAAAIGGDSSGPGGSSSSGPGPGDGGDGSSNSGPGGSGSDDRGRDDRSGEGDGDELEIERERDGGEDRSEPSGGDRSGSGGGGESRSGPSGGSEPEPEDDPAEEIEIEDSSGPSESSGSGDESGSGSLSSGSSGSGSSGGGSESSGSGSSGSESESSGSSEDDFEDD